MFKGLKLKPVTRLSVIFILAIVLSGSILTYFSINNISNLKELTEKRIIEEQRELYRRFSDDLHNRIDYITAGLITGSGLIKDSLIKKPAEFNFIIQPFIIKNNRQFKFPNFDGIHERPTRPLSSEKYTLAYKKGERAEFVKKDFGDAEQHYLSCLNFSEGSKDSIKTINALGRIAIKKNNIKDALNQYNGIIINYFDVLDENGSPCIYYALDQILKNSGDVDAKMEIPVFELALEKMISGNVPLNQSTAGLITQMTEWLKKYNNDADDQAHIHELINEINKQLLFVGKYRDELSGLLDRGNHNKNYYSGDNGFKVINAFPTNNQEFFLINTDLSNPAGFLIDRAILFDTIVKSGIQEGLNFSYNIEFPSGFTPGNNRPNLSYYTMLNPYFPGQMMNITLKNENLLNDIVIRRSWIYGIASILLLVAMALGVALILRDISREKHLALIRSNFISNVTHELKTPLTSIRMYAESMMLDRVRSAKDRKYYLSVVVSESERLKRMINNILEFSKMEKEKQEFHPVETRLSEILFSAISDLNYWIKEKEFNIQTDIEKNIKARVDPEKFRQVYTNLLSNAIKFSGNSRNIYVRLFRNSNGIITEIEDNGIGIAYENQKKIFEEFYQIDCRETGDITGTGLGLTVAREIVESHNGKILVDSEIGKGSKFSVILFI